MVYDYYYDEDAYAVNDQMGGFPPNGQGSNKENWPKGQGNQGQNYGNYNWDDQYVQDRIYNCENNFIRNNYGNLNDRSGPYIPPQNWKFAPRDGGGSIVRV